MPFTPQLFILQSDVNVDISNYPDYRFEIKPYSSIGGEIGMWLGFIAVVFAMINVVGGFLVTDRMLKMFKKK